MKKSTTHRTSPTVLPSTALRPVAGGMRVTFFGASIEEVGTDDLDAPRVIGIIPTCKE